MSFRKWLEKAEKDLVLAKNSLSLGYYDYATFHAQQCAEKALKAFLVSKGKPIKRTHDIGELILLCADVDSEFLKLFDDDVDLLTAYAVEARYPTIHEPEKEEAENAIKLAELVLAFVKSKLTSP
ncbi:HEPN domain-containing protein [Thermococcus thioreducens]|uniref:HEPN domain-containing protein n=1 Tax=Thermococcus thioreducens TaxID=277988 RepID=A0A0Q2S752_9EURY|nr:HEPN domain-containing protein [Thermococcus thioreducens]ASJ12450.1 nucleotidyltransferase [Thermococcus thioreducens]KQH83179.1 nucleotidyltransferase [Thermococcus thioreducens]SEV90599.1 HEPN domain-containing protein [Thermococcus thioreducens]